MKVSGSAGLSAGRDRVWEALHDPAVLVRTIPGCERLETIGLDAYRMTVTAGVGSIRGRYDGEVQLTDQNHPDSFVLKARGAGGPGTVDASVTVRLAADGNDRTQLTYDADALVGGMLAGVGQRMLAGVAKKTAGEFFAAVDDVLTGRVAEARATEGAAAAAPVGVAGSAAPAPAGAVYTAPARARPAIPAGWVLAAAVVGALIALAGVLIGWAIAS